MKFLLDANMPYSSIKTLKSIGHQAMHVSGIGLGAAADEMIMEYAAKRKLILVTRDLDFGTLAVYVKIRSYGLIILRLPFSYIAKGINASLRSFLGAVSSQRVVRSLAIVEVGKYRIRKL